MNRNFAFFVLFGVVNLSGLACGADEPLGIGSRRELFVDRVLIDRLSGGAELVLQKPTAREMVFVADKPWEGNTSAYFTIFQDGDLFRMYYRGSHFDEQTKKPTHAEVACYAESKDGLHWTKPELGLHEFEGSKQNNIVWTTAGSHNFTPFKDQNPACTPDARYKALAGGRGGLLALKSADGLRWTTMAEKPVITKGAFDSQNLAFWDAHAKTYREYHRDFRKIRDIRTGTSPDFLTWTAPEFLEYPGVELQQLYTNAIQPYDRAPHILIGFPTRYLANAQQQVEPTFMASRDGRTFQRWLEPVIPLTAPENRDGNRSNYMAWALLRLPGDKNEMSVYGTEAYYTGAGSRLRRFTYRTDGFVALHAPASGGELLTKPLRFEGEKLTLNFRAPTGRVRVELQTADGQPIAQFSLADCQELRGDDVDQTVRWKPGASLKSLAGKPLRLRFELADADLFAFQFSGGQPAGGQPAGDQ